MWTHINRHVNDKPFKRSKGHMFSEETFQPVADGAQYLLCHIQTTHTHTRSADLTLTVMLMINPLKGQKVTCSLKKLFSLLQLVLSISSVTYKPHTHTHTHTHMQQQHHTQTTHHTTQQH